MVEGASLNPMMGWCVVELDLARTKSVRYWPIIKCVAGLSFIELTDAKMVICLTEMNM